MTFRVFLEFFAFRRKLMLKLLALAIAGSIALKYFNLLIAYFGNGEAGSIGNVAGMSLLRFVSGLSWPEALYLGAVACLSVVMALSLMCVVNRLRIRMTVTNARPLYALKSELATLALLLVVTAIVGAIGITASQTIAFMCFVPLTLYSLLNPAWGNHKRARRYSAAVLIGLGAFVFVGSKFIILHFVIAVLLNGLFYGSKRILPIVFFSLFIFIYPYLNMFRGLLSENSIEMAFFMTLSELSHDHSYFGFIQVALNSYSAILDRLVGLDGLLVASNFEGMTNLSSKEIAYQLVGFEGIGISLSLFGQLYLRLGDIWLVSILYPIIVAVTWKTALALDSFFASINFTSVGAYVFVKAIHFLIGGFHWVDVKLTFSVLVTIAILGFIMRRIAKVSKFSSKRESQRFSNIE